MRIRCGQRFMRDTDGAVFVLDAVDDGVYMLEGKHGATVRVSMMELHNGFECLDAGPDMSGWNGDDRV